jgi:hypothetical protein
MFTGAGLEWGKGEAPLTERIRRRLRRDWEDPQNESIEREQRVIDLTDASDQVAPEDYPVLVFLRDQLVEARQESERLKQQLNQLTDQSQELEASRYEAALSQLRDHYEALLDDEQRRRSELQASLESERLLRMEAETKIESVRDELKRVRLELRTAVKNERARAVRARTDLAKLQEEVALLTSKYPTAEQPIEEPALEADDDNEEGASSPRSTQKRGSSHSKSA